MSIERYDFYDWSEEKFDYIIGIFEYFRLAEDFESIIGLALIIAGLPVYFYWRGK